MILSYLPQPEKHPLWNEIVKLLEPATDDCPVMDANELVWIAFEGTTLFAAATTGLFDREARVLACGGFEHRRWLKEAEALVTRWATDCGAQKITMRGRKGWERYFRRFGWGVSPADGNNLIYEKVL